MSEEVENIDSGNIDKLIYNIETSECTVYYKGGSKIKYKNITNDAFDRMLLTRNVKSVLQEIRVGNIVGVRV